MHQFFQGQRQAGVGIEIDRTLAGLSPDQADGLGDDLGLQQGLAFAALTETDDGFFGPGQVFNRHLADLFRAWHKGDPFLGRGTAAGWLQ